MRTGGSETTTVRLVCSQQTMFSWTNRWDGNFKSWENFDRQSLNEQNIFQISKHGSVSEPLLAHLHRI